MTQYEAIGRRHSVRRFQMTAIDPHIMKQINCFIQTLAPLHPQAAYRIAVVEAYNTQKHVFKGMFLVQAPYYLVLSAKDHPFAAVNAGYVMEQLVLYLVSKGFAHLGKKLASSGGYYSYKKTADGTKLVQSAVFVFSIQPE